MDGSGKCPGYTLESQEHFVFRGHAGPDRGPSDHLPSVAETPCPPAPVLSEAASLQSRQPGSSSVVRSPLPSLSDYCRTFWFPSPPRIFFLPQPPFSDDLPEPGPSGSRCRLLPTGKRGLGGQKGLGPERPQLLACPLPPPTLVLTPGLLLPPLPLAGPLSSQDHSGVTLPARGKGGSFTSPFVSRSPHPLPTFPRTSPWKPVCFQRR